MRLVSENRVAEPWVLLAKQLLLNRGKFWIKATFPLVFGDLSNDLFRTFRSPFLL